MILLWRLALLRQRAFVLVPCHTGRRLLTDPFGKERRLRDGLMSPIPANTSFRKE
jgi:hypothetical protein